MMNKQLARECGRCVRFKMFASLAPNEPLDCDDSASRTRPALSSAPPGLGRPTGNLLNRSKWSRENGRGFQRVTGGRRGQGSDFRLKASAINGSGRHNATMARYRITSLSGPQSLGLNTSCTAPGVSCRQSWLQKLAQCISRRRLSAPLICKLLTRDDNISIPAPTPALRPSGF